MCKLLHVSKNAYYSWKRGECKEPSGNKEAHKKTIGEIFEENKGRYGSYRICKAMNGTGLDISRAYVGRLMKEMGLRARTRKKFVATTDSKHALPVAPNLLNRDFAAERTGMKWVGDITYVWTDEGWAYLTTVIDLADRRVVGWSLSADMTTENTVWAAWVNARAARGIHEGFVFHSDRGAQYASAMFSGIFRDNKKASQSMSRKGNCWDNAVAESFFKTIKYEELNHYSFENREQLYQCIEEYILWYNTKRMHSSLGYQTPLEREIEIYNQFKNAA